VAEELNPLVEPAGPQVSDAEPSVFAQGVRYLLVGGSSALLELAIFWVLSSPLDLDVRISNVIAVLIATVCNFLMNRQWTFKSSSHWVRSAVLYLTLWSLNLVFTTSVIAYADGQGFSPTLAKIGTMALVTLWNFWLFRKVVFA
jgi:putative flippase GtrA